ncbi:MAG: anti-sigma factor antagonist [Clostridiales bacterium]|nr:anti-sigma factor antagonist [Clostridiales bacterium]
MEQFQVKKKTLVIRMPKELDHHSAEQIRREADRMIAGKNINQVEFDFRDTEFMDSSGIGVLMGRYQNVRLLGGGVEATHVNDRIYKVMQLAGLPKVIGIDRKRFWNQGE